MKAPKQLYTEISIQAPVHKVWDLLMDFERYPQWNPFIKSIKGRALPGQALEVNIVPPGSRGMRLRPRVLKCEKSGSFSWQGHLSIPGIFDGEHIFELIPEGTGTKFIQRENFKGLLIPFFKKMLEVDTRRGFEAMNTALKALAEGA